MLAGTVYFLCASTTIGLARFDGGLAVLWVANAFLIAWLTASPRGQWGPSLAACGAAAFLAGALFGFGPAAALPFPPLHLGEAVLTVALLRRWHGSRAYFDSVEGIARFACVAGGLVPCLIAVPAALHVASLGAGTFWQAWLQWYAGHALGTIAFTPLALLMIQNGRRLMGGESTARRRLEAVILFSLVASVTVAVFSQAALPLLFAPMLPMMVATVRLGRLGAAGSTVLLAVIGGVLTMRQSGPIYMVDAGPVARAQFFQFYVACAAMLTLPVAAVFRQRDELMARLSRSEASYRLLAEHSGDAIMHLATDGTILYASPAVWRMADLDPDTLLGRNARELVHEQDRSAVAAAHRMALEQPGTDSSVEYRLRTIADAARWFETNTRAVLDDDGVVTAVVSATREISSRKAAEFRLVKAAATDPLTGFLNRRAFMELLDRRVEQVAAGKGACTVAIFDLDHFKAINDGHGHAAGDLVLKSFATVARRTLREQDAIGRIGGEEFGVILWNIAAEDGAVICERLRRAVASAEVAVDDGAVLSVTTSVGIAPIVPASDGATALRLADHALYEAKAHGRNCLKRAA